MNPEHLAPWIPLIQTAVQVVGLIIALVVVMVQLSRQHRNAIAEQRDQAREHLRLEIYKEINPKITAAAMALSRAGSRCWVAVRALELRRKRLNETGLASEPLHTPSEEELDSAHYEALDHLLEVMWVLEGFEIAFQGFDSFRRHLGRAHGDLLSAFSTLKIEIAPLLPVVWPPAEQDRSPQLRKLPQPPDEQSLAELDKLVDGLRQVEYDTLGYLFDLRVAAQNRLLFELFPGSKVRERQPADPRFEVLRPTPRDLGRQA